MSERQFDSNYNQNTYKPIVNTSFNPLAADFNVLVVFYEP